jgi:hypothetical protein
VLLRLLVCGRFLFFLEVDHTDIAPDWICLSGTGSLIFLRIVYVSLIVLVILHFLLSLSLLFFVALVLRICLILFVFNFLLLCRGFSGICTPSLIAFLGWGFIRLSGILLLLFVSLLLLLLLALLLALGLVLILRILLGFLGLVGLGFRFRLSSVVFL